MGRYLAVRLYSMALTVLGLTALVFLMLRLVPGTVVEQMIGADAVVSPQMVEQAQALLRAGPAVVRAVRALAGRPAPRRPRGLVAHGQARDRAHPRAAARDPGADRAGGGLRPRPADGGGRGVSAIWRGRPLDTVTRVGTLLGLSIPVSRQGTMLILFFSLTFRWMPSVVWVDLWTDPLANLTIMALPALCLGHGERGAASPAPCRACCSTSCAPTTSARPRPRVSGRPRRRLPRHGLRNALIPVVTVAGLQMGILLGGTVVVEEVFALPGLGRLRPSVIYERDYPVTQTPSCSSPSCS